MKFTKRGQAALEFLTTYGWAFLVILVMIGALGYFGVLSPGNFLPQRCNVGPEFSCNDYQAVRSASDVNVSAILVSNIGEAMAATPSDFSAESGSVTANACELSADGAAWSSGATTVNIAAGGELWLRCDFAPGGLPPSGDKGKFLIQGKYKPTGKNFDKPITTEIYATLQS